jgi:hypothetical protein
MSDREQIRPLSEDTTCLGQKRVVPEAASTPSCQTRSLLHRLLAQEAAAGDAEIAFVASDESWRQQKQPLAKVTFSITMEFGSSIESRLRGLWSDTSFDLQLFLYASTYHPIGFTFIR